MYSDAPLTSQGADPYLASQPAQPQPVPQYTVPPQQQQQTRSTGDMCRSCFTSKAMKYIVTFSVMIICPALMGVVGVLAPYLMFTRKTGNYFASLLFSIYTFFLALVLLLVEFRIKFIGRIFVFLLSPTWRSLFLIFLGTLSMASFETIDKFEWIGYLVGAVTIIIGVFQIIIGCLDKDWKKQQVNKYKEQGAAQGWAQPQAQPQPPVVQPPLNDQLTSANAAPAQPYPSLAGDAGMPSQAVYTQQQPMTSQAPLESQQDANRQLAMEAAKMPETRQLASATMQAAGGTLMSGGSTEDAMLAAASNQQVQQAAFDATVAAMKNEQVRHAAGQAASQAVNKAMTSAYDRIFEDE